MNTALAPIQYSQKDQNESRAEIKRELDRRHRRGVDLELGADRLIIRSPDGSRFALTVDNAGVLSAVGL
jgi:hypothetical protein